MFPCCDEVQSYDSCYLFAIFLFGFPFQRFSARALYLMRPKNHKFKSTVLRDVLSNVARDLVVGFSLTMVSLVLVLPAMDLFGLFNPAVASWGRIMYDAWNVPTGFERWWSWLPPLIFTALLALGFYLLGSSLDERFE